MVLYHLLCTTPFFLISLLDNKIEKVLFAKYVIEELGDDQLDKVLDGLALAKIFRRGRVLLIMDRGRVINPGWNVRPLLV